MKLKISLSDFQVTELTSELLYPGIKNNGQHYQLPGYVLSTVEKDKNGTFIKLYHPETEPSCGHYDLQYQPSDWRAGSPLQQYALFQEISLGEISRENYLWPTGTRSLVMTLDAIERYLARIDQSYQPQLWDWLTSRDETGNPHFAKEVEELEIIQDAEVVE